MVRPRWVEDKALWKSVRLKVLREYPGIDMPSSDCDFLMKAHYLLAQGRIEKSYQRCFENTLEKAQAYVRATTTKKGPRKGHWKHIRGTAKNIGHEMRPRPKKRQPGLLDPPFWAMDEKIWRRAAHIAEGIMKKKKIKDTSVGYAIAVVIYRNMGGRKASPVRKSHLVLKALKKPFESKMPGKGKAHIGEERQWKSGKFKKVAEGKWQPVSDKKEPARQRSDAEEEKKANGEAKAQAAVFVTQLAAKIGKGVAEKMQELYEGRILEGIARMIGEAGEEPGRFERVSAAKGAPEEKEKESKEKESKERTAIEVAPGQKPKAPKKAIKEETAKKAKIAEQTKEGDKAAMKVAKRAEATEKRIAGRSKTMKRKADIDITRGTKQEQEGKIRRPKEAVPASVLAEAKRKTVYDIQQAAKKKRLARKARGRV